MRSKWCLFLLLVLTLILINSMLGCKSTSSESEADQAKEFADAFISYASEVKLAEEIANERLNKATGLLESGEINTIEFRKRCYQATLIHAYTLEYIDRKPQYEMLFPFLFGEEQPPSLGWCIPELERDPEAIEAQYESYMQDYIDYHYFALSEAVEKIGPPESN